MSENINLDISENLLDERTKKTILNAIELSKELLEASKLHLNAFLKTKEFPIDNICFIAVGSVGRYEAIKSSDFDLIPILKDTESLEKFKDIDKEGREYLKKKLERDISKGEDLTQCIDIETLKSQDAIGTEKDNSSSLTKRILILTEGQQAGGNYDIKSVKEELLNSYASAQTTSGRHVLSLFNDIARYYRTLCIEYKSKIDTKDKDWCVRNMKLRHSRKFWYFSTMISIVKIAYDNPHGNEIYKQKLLETLDFPPYKRMINSVKEYCPNSLAKLFERFAWFLDFMSEENHRCELSKIEHDKRYENSLKNPFPGLKFNSDILHESMVRIIESLPLDMKRKLMDWFLL